jgi:carnitine-CoA ligase
MEPDDAVSLFAPHERTLPTMLTRQAERFGDRPLVTAGEHTWSFAQACEQAARFAGTLRAAGVRQGERIALIASNRIEFLQVFLGCAWLGAICVPINAASRGPQLQHILSNCGARLLIIEANCVGNLDYLDFAPLPLDTVWLIDLAASSRIGPLTCCPMPAPVEAIAPAALRPDDLVAILYTSGTTGPSKGVCSPHAQYFWWGRNTSRLLQLRDGDVLCTALPLFHTNALNTFYQALLTGARVICEPRFSASAFFTTLAARDATVTYLLGAMVPILLSRERSAAERSHRVRLALAPGVPARFHQEFIDRTGIRLLDGWGSTETNFALGTTVADQKPGLMGPAADGFHARVVDDAGNDLPDGEPGELAVRADDPLAFASGYFAMPRETADAWRGGWFHTGDRVIREPHGYFRFVDRLKDAIRRRGENVSAFEVEQVLLSHPAVANAAVFPVRATLAEDEVMAAVVLQPGFQSGELALIEFCAPRLPYFAVPRYVEFFTELPVTENGKVQKYRLRERGVTAATWDREAVGYMLRR